MVELNFDATQYEPSTGGGAASVFETGMYDFVIVNTDRKMTKSGNGRMFVVTFSCFSPGFQGRILIDRFNVEHTSQEAMDIAKRELSALCYSVGVLQPRDSSELHGRPLKISVDKVERTDRPGTYGNEVRGYFDHLGNPPVRGTQQYAAQPTSAPTTVAAPQPWQSPTAPAPVQQYGPPPVTAPAPVAAAAPAYAVAPAPANGGPAPAPQQPWQQQPAPAPQPWQTAPNPQPAAGPTPPWAS